MTAQVVPVHFSVNISQTLGPDALPGWADYIRDWLKDGSGNSPERFFGRDSPNSLNGTPTFSNHLHVIPEDDVKAEAWLAQDRAFKRVSDDLVIYSLDKAKPYLYGILLIDFLADPTGHKVAFNQGASGQQRRDAWETIAWKHQNGVFTPAYTF